MDYLIIVEKTKTGYSAYSPDILGCVSTERSREEVEKNMREAIEFHLDGLREEGFEIPKPRSDATYAKVPVQHQCLLDV